MLPVTGPTISSYRGWPTEVEEAKCSSANQEWNVQNQIAALAEELRQAKMERSRVVEECQQYKVVLQLGADWCQVGAEGHAFCKLCSAYWEHCDPWVLAKEEQATELQ